jgi:limonene-1,2-epoxide hydrolase
MSTQQSVVTRQSTVTRRNFAIAAGASAVALAACKQQAPAAPAAPAESEAEKTVRTFLAKMGESFDAQVDAYRQYFTPESVWIQSGLPDITGAEAAVAMVTGARPKGLETVKIDIINIASKGDVVHTERVDHMVGPDGATIASLPVAGVFTVKNGKIARWADYFDPRHVLEAFAGP